MPVQGCTLPFFTACETERQGHIQEDRSLIITLFLAADFFLKTFVVRSGFHRLSCVHYMYMNKKKKKKEKEKKRRRRNSSVPHKEQIAHSLVTQFVAWSRAAPDTYKWK